MIFTLIVVSEFIGGMFDYGVFYVYSLSATLCWLFLAILDNGESGDYADNTYHFRQGSTSLYFWDLPYAGLAIWISYCMDGIQPALCEKA